MNTLSNLAIWHQGILALAALLLVTAALWDAWRYRIPNFISLALLALFPAYALTASPPLPWGQHLFIAALVLAAGYYLYSKKYIGAGDIKLLSVASLWAGPDRVGLLLFITTIAGGLLALLTAGVTVYRHHKSGASGKASVAKTPIPYGVAIAIGALCILIMSSHPILFS